MSTLITFQATVVISAVTLSRAHITSFIQSSQWVTFTSLAFWEVIVSFITAPAVLSCKVILASTVGDFASGFTDTTHCSIYETGAVLADWRAKVAISTLFTEWCLEVGLALTNSCQFSTIARMLGLITPTLLAGVPLCNVVSTWPIVAWAAELTVDAHCVVVAVLAFTSSLVFIIFVQGKTQFVHSPIVLALSGVAMAITLFALEDLV